MPPNMGVSTLIAGMFITGCANSLLSKYQDKLCVENCDSGAEHPRVDFEQPVYQTLNMFIGEFMCCLPLLWRHLAASKSGSNGFLVVSQDEDDQIDDDRNDDEDGVVLQVGRTLSGWRVCWMWFPAFCDICGTTLMNVGLILTPVSIYQMSRGALVLWVGVLSVIFLRRHLWLYQWASLVIVTLGVALVGLAGTLVKKATLPGRDNPIHPPGGVAGILQDVVTRSDDDPAKVALGVILILVAQVFTATQYVVEEKIMSHYKVEPLAAVSLEGFFGGVTTLLAMPLLHIFFSTRSSYFDIPRGWHQLIGTPGVIWSCVAIAFSIGAFNFFGLSVTSRVSATTRSTVDTCRTLGIWIVSLSIGWEALVWPFSLLQVGGFAMLVYGTFVFNGLIAPILFPPPPSVHLPHEPELEETGEVPAAQAQGRAGYDVVPTDE